MPRPNELRRIPCWAAPPLNKLHHTPNELRHTPNELHYTPNELRHRTHVNYRMGGDTPPLKTVLTEYGVGT
jgi:hypothetical protein